ncbi:MAG TPA: DNA polymerase III subunit gamma and tau [Actinoplanes sp.]|nr:DNA polymerase III subunit gamma and tau [Actinoplanes sp.]
MALALYRKYRPRTFAEVIGQEHVTEPLSQALRSGRLHHAYLFSGPRGCGKTSSARILARSLNCEQGPTPEPCGVCASCKSLANDGVGSIDVIEIDAASHGGVDDARDLREKAFFAPASSRYKIYVIDEAHMVSSAGFNALLKLVEEPPDYVKFIFATTEPEKVLGTIRSRTHHYPFRLIPPAVLRPYLQQLTEAEGVRVEPAVFPLVVKAGGGSARDTLSVLDQLIAGAGPEGVSYSRAVALLGVTDVALIDEMCDSLAAGDGAAAYATIDRVAEAGHDARRFASDLLERFRDLIILQQVPDAVTKGLIDGPADQLDAMTAQATRLGPATLSRCADIVHNGLIEMRGTTAPRLLLELITARMLLPGAEDSTGALLQRLERMERRLTLSADPDFVRAEPAPPSPAQSAGEPVASGGGISAARAAAAAAGRRAPTGPQPVEGVSEASDQPPAEVPVRPGPRESAPPDDEVPGQSERGGAGAGLHDGEGDNSPEAAVEAPDRVSAAPSAADATQSWSGEGARPVEAGRPGDGMRPDGVNRSGEGQAPGGARSDEFGQRNGAAAQGEAVPSARRAEPAGVMPDAPEEPAADPGPTGQLSAAAIREVWPEIMIAVGRKSKKIAALAQGATVRDLDGQTVVLTFRFPAHAKMVAAEPALISDALYEALGGRWQIRCDVAGEAGPSQGTATSGRGGGQAGGGQAGGGETGGGASDGGNGAASRTAPSQGGPNRGGSEPSWPGQDGPGQAARVQNAAPAQPRSGRGPASARREPSPQAMPADDGDDWPEPARLGGNDIPEPVSPGQEDWPEPARLGGTASPSDQSEGTVAAGSATLPSAAGAARAAASPANPRLGSPAGVGGGGSARDDSGGDADGMTAPGRGAGGPAGAGADDVPGALAEAGNGRGNGGTAGAVGRRDTGGPADARSTPRNAGPGGVPGTAASVTAGRPTPKSGLAAARAAAANAGRSSATGAATPATATGAAATAAAPSASWSDASTAAEEPPYDPDYDGPVRGPAAFEGFDPGDEPLDDVIDEKVARQSSEQQAMQLLQEAFGAEKISEI